MHKAKEGRLMDWVGCHAGNKLNIRGSLGGPSKQAMLLWHSDMLVLLAG